MKIQLSCQHTTLTAALTAAVQERFDRLASHTNLPTTAHVVLTANEGGINPHKADASLLVNGKTIHASAVAKDMYSAIDSLVSRLDRRLRKTKTARLSTRVEGSLRHVAP